MYFSRKRTSMFSKNIIAAIIGTMLVIVTVLAGIFAIPRLNPKKTEIVEKDKKTLHQERSVDGEIIHLDLLDPQLAPDNIRDEVMTGYNIILHTNKILPKNVEDRLTCNNCHFAGGNTLGGKRGGISLLGVDRIYPRYAERLGKVIDLEERINNCFMRSMNGRPIPRDSKEMRAIVTYFKWISSKVPERKNYPWLGMEPLASKHTPNPKNGAKIYARNCSSCHMKNGEGTEHNPPLWGPHSFNDGAGMYHLPKLASFIFNNMPYNDPFLTEEQALDVAAFLTKQRRPNFIEQQIAEEIDEIGEKIKKYFFSLID